jgi:hypothetical protein
MHRGPDRHPEDGDADEQTDLRSLVHPSPPTSLEDGQEFVRRMKPDHAQVGVLAPPRAE